MGVLVAMRGGGLREGAFLGARVAAGAVVLGLANGCSPTDFGQWVSSRMADHPLGAGQALPTTAVWGPSAWSLVARAVSGRYG